MTGAEILAAITGFFEFFKEVSAFIQLIRGTPAEQRQKAITASFEAMKKFKESDTSEAEDILNG
jgi:hypothetical protein